jgi:hypothetical protein
MKRPRNITRIDNEVNHTHAWRVTLQRMGEIMVGTFSDGVYGGKQKALKAAVEFRDSLLAYDQPFEHRLWVRTRLRKSNTSGIAGVGRYEAIANPNTGRRTAFWLATWVDEHGNRRRRKFYVSRYGERGAKRRAIEERERQLNRVCLLKSGKS